MRIQARGFTLIEVLVALVIVAISLAAGIKAAGALTDNAARLQSVSAAQWCAENQLTELRLSKQFPSVGDADFSCEQLGRIYRGRLAVRPTPNPNFRRVDALVSDADGVPQLTLSTIMGRYLMPKRKARGFTLVEVLVALVVMATMAMMAWRGLDALLKSRDIAQANLDQSARLQTVLAQWELDVRSVQDSGAVTALSFDGASLRITRLQAQGLQVVAWTVRSGRLYRWEGPVVQTVAALEQSFERSQQLLAQEGQQLRALEGVSGWQMYFYRGNSWSNAQSSGNVIAPPSPPAGGGQGPPPPSPCPAACAWCCNSARAAASVGP